MENQTQNVIRVFGTTRDVAQRIVTDVLQSSMFLDYGKMWWSPNVDALYFYQPERITDNPVDNRPAGDVEEVVRLLNTMPVGSTLDYSEDIGECRFMNLRKTAEDEWSVLEEGVSEIFLEYHRTQNSTGDEKREEEVKMIRVFGTTEELAERITTDVYEDGHNSGLCEQGKLWSSNDIWGLYMYQPYRIKAKDEVLKPRLPKDKLLKALQDLREGSCVFFAEDTGLSRFMTLRKTGADEWSVWVEGHGEEECTVGEEVQ